MEEKAFFVGLITLCIVLILSVRYVFRKIDKNDKELTQEKLDGIDKAYRKANIIKEGLDKTFKGE